jgi:hypothetical protein
LRLKRPKSILNSCLWAVCKRTSDRSGGTIRAGAAAAKGWTGQEWCGGGVEAEERLVIDCYGRPVDPIRAEREERNGRAKTSDRKI